MVHVRDGRSGLLVKLALLGRIGGDTGELVTGQRAAFSQIEAALVRRRQGEAGFDRVLAAWRIESVRAALRFLDP